MTHPLRLLPLFVLGTVSLLLSCSDDGGGGGGSNNCEAVCDMPRNCSMDSDKALCVNECQALAKACPSQARALNNCTLGREASDFECDDFNETSLKEGICEAEGNAVFACFLGGADVTLGDTETQSDSDTSSAGNGTTSPSSTVSPSTATTNEQGDDTSRDIESVAPSGDPKIDCDSYCALTQMANCGETLEACLMECEQDAAELPDACVSSYAQLMDCMAQEPGSFECDGTNPVGSEGVCQPEQSEFVECIVRAQVPAEDQAICTEICVGVNVTPPIDCPNDEPTTCELECLVTAAVLGVDCTDESIAASACTAAADASQWICDTEGEASFDGSTCATEQAAVLACFLGTE